MRRSLGVLRAQTALELTASYRRLSAPPKSAHAEMWRCERAVAGGYTPARYKISSPKPACHASAVVAHELAVGIRT